MMENNGLMRKTLISLSVILALLELMLIWLFSTGRLEAFDHTLREALLTLDPSSAVAMWRGITFLGSGVVITALAVVSIVVFALRAEWQALKYVVFAMIGAVIIDTGLKTIIHRARPTEVFANTMPSSYSFPSGHALFAFVFYLTAAMILAPRLNGIARATFWSVAVLLVVLIGASRLFLGVHYPTDVLGGYIAGAFWLSVVQLSLPRNPYASGWSTR